MNQKLPLSIAMITFNEEENLPRTLEALKGWVGEIVIVDSHSADRTREIAESYGARFFDEDWKGHVAQKNSALQKCTQPWILPLDADEVVTPALRTAIESAVTSDAPMRGYRINRKTVYLGRLLHYAWQPDWKSRLVQKGAGARWGGYDPHDVLQMDSPWGRLEGDLLHYSYRDIEDHFQRTVKYARITARSYHEMGKKFRWHKLLLSPLFSFVKDYIIRQGFRDGMPGLIAGFSAPIYVFLKYLFLWEYERNADS